MPIQASSWDELHAAKERARERFFPRTLEAGTIGRRAPLTVSAAAAAARSNVHAVGIGPKLAKGSVSPVLCVRLYVVQKLPPSAVPSDARLPDEIDGVPTDVIESPPAFILPPVQGASPGGPLMAAAALPPCSVNRRTKQRPVVPGISVAHDTVTAGTLAALCASTNPEDGGEAVFVLSNNHVFADVNKGRKADALWQPGWADGGTGADTFAKLHRFVPIQLGGTVPNHVDCAIGELHDGIDYSPAICSIGLLTGTERATENMMVRKHGRTTGYTEGRVTDVAYDALVGMDHNDSSVVALFEDQLRIERMDPFPSFGLGGDSGSLVANKDRNSAVGLYFAGPEDGSYGVANPIEDVVRELQITLL